MLTIDAWVKEHGVEASHQEIQDFLNEQKPANTKLTDEDLDQIAGGKDEPKPVPAGAVRCTRCDGYGILYLIGGGTCNCYKCLGTGYVFEQNS